MVKWVIYLDIYGMCLDRWTCFDEGTSYKKLIFRFKTAKAINICDNSL